jgi:hypothetical protein
MQGKALSGAAASTLANWAKSTKQPARRILLIERLPGQTNTGLLHVQLCIRRCPIEQIVCYFLIVDEFANIVFVNGKIR